MQTNEKNSFADAPRGHVDEKELCIEWNGEETKKKILLKNHISRFTMNGTINNDYVLPSFVFL